MGHQKGMALLNIVKAQASLEKRLQPLGISVTWNEFSSTAPLLDGMGAGAIVFGGGGGTGSVFAQAGDKSFVRVAAGTGSTRGSAILVQENSPIKTLSDLKGKKVAFAKGSGQHNNIVRALEKVGLKFSDIKPLYLTPAEALPAFERGDIDAWLIWDPYTAEAERKLRTRLLADNSTVFGDKAPLESPSFYYAAPDFVRDYPDILKTILQELEKAGAWSRDNYQDSAKLLYKLYKIDLKTMETVEERGGQREVLPVTDEVLSGLQRMADTFYELGEPKVLLSDEATSALDPQTTRSILDLLRDLNKRMGLTILLITHEMAVVKQICDSVAVLNAGKIVEKGYVSDLIAKPESFLAQEFFHHRNGYKPKPGAVIATIAFAGEQASQPIFATLARNFDVDVNILSGSVETVGDRRVGQFHIELEGQKVTQALKYLHEAEF
ncbi:MAG: aliphatic sulfonate ABC transporter substrate-binding protein [Nostoc sp.]|uniref:aliphatic sulfonate ABC transporter substrate-binding protein n=1 Tax=Nostoc sp. TaxID=1180 RepID=UPI002FF71B44